MEHQIKYEMEHQKYHLGTVARKMSVKLSVMENYQFTTLWKLY